MQSLDLAQNELCISSQAEAQFSNHIWQQILSQLFLIGLNFHPYFVRYKFQINEIKRINDVIFKRPEPVSSFHKPFGVESVIN